MKIIYNIEKLKREAKRLKDLSFDEECSFDISKKLQLEAKELENKILFITKLRDLAGKEKERYEKEN